MDVITFPENLQTTNGLSILLHGVISLPDAMSYDNVHYVLVHVRITVISNVCKTSRCYHQGVGG